ncbi:hypothetical protein BSR29_00630 [Boudabousia liubingyangii]|uniref:Transcriptional regulator WhiB n=1 Tax=Boudabousia liubingyangii TaxID=1921764 RepID=A0A1Q5PPI2_9ACTO|nr:WhiB family transcriptional regulator [Boudabousia liubingyangii]OKL48470.1 hypothetical protein BSR28_01880 [Boudabousia liubingyangii]OKL49501.1 hypothetical protein BSR29_00630 [Boudabousia liubingyangii]
MNEPNARCWERYARCAPTHSDSLFANNAEQKAIREICFDCPVRMHCLAQALEEGMNYGVWGGLTERERRVLLRSQPEQSRWAEWLRRSDDPLARRLREPRDPAIYRFLRRGQNQKYTGSSSQPKNGID